MIFALLYTNGLQNGLVYFSFYFFAAYYYFFNLIKLGNKFCIYGVGNRHTRSGTSESVHAPQGQWAPHKSTSHNEREKKGPHNPQWIKGEKARAPQPTSEQAFLSARESSPELNVLLVRTALNLLSQGWWSDSVSTIKLN